MAEDPQTPEIDNEDDELLLDTPIEGADPEDDDTGEEEVLVFGDAAEPSDDDTSLVKHLREQIRERDRKLAEARDRPEPIVVGEKPTLWDDGIDGDEDKYDSAMDAYRDRQRKAAAQREAVTGNDDEAKADWEAAFGRYREGKTKLGYADIDDAQATVEATLNTQQQAALIMAADDPAKVMYALAKNPDRLAALAAERNPLKLAVQIAKLEGTLKMVKRRRAPDPEEVVTGSARISPVGADKTLAKLEKEAATSGDRSAVVAYKKKLKLAKK